MKKTWIIVSIIAALLIGAFLYLKIRKSKDFEPLIKAKLQQLVKDGSDSLYVLEMDKIEVDVLNSKAVVRNARLLIDSARLKVLTAEGKAPVDVYKISLSDLNIDGLNINDFLSKKDIDLDVLTIKNPVFEIYHPVGEDTAVYKDTVTLYSRIQKSLGHFHLKNLAILNMNFIYHNIEHTEKSTAFNNVSMKFRDIEIDSLTQYDTTRFLYAKDALIYLYDYSFRTPDSLYIAKADSLTLHASQRMLDIKGLYLEPRGNKQEFSKKLTYYKDRYDIKFESASFKDIDWYHLFLGESFTANKAEFNNGEMQVYANKNIPISEKSKVGNYPHQLLMRLGFSTNVDTILVKNFKFIYTELNPKSEKTGDIVFDDIDATITNVTNIPEKIALNKIVKLSATSKLMSKGNFDAVFTFDLTKAKSGDFTVDANLGPMDGTYLNEAAKPLGLFEINSVSIKNLKTHIQGNNFNAHGSVYLVYDDLKITALKIDDSNKLKSRGFLSFIANTFVINKSNSKAEAKQEYSSFKRDPERSFFYLIWKTLLTGIKQTVS